MAQASRHSAIEALRDKRCVEIRALRPEDRDELAKAFGRASANSIYRRFFAVKRNFTEQEIALSGHKYELQLRWRVY